MRNEKTWPGFAAVINESEYSSEQVQRWFGLSENELLNWFEHGAPISAHIAIRTKLNLGMCDPVFEGWRVEDGWLVAPNNRKISMRRLARIAELHQEETIRLVHVNS